MGCWSTSNAAPIGLRQKVAPLSPVSAPYSGHGPKKKRETLFRREGNWMLLVPGGSFKILMRQE